VPLVSFEGACGQMIPPASGRTRIVIFTASARAGRRLLGIVSQGFPQLVRVTQMWCVRITRAPLKSAPPIVCQIRMVNETPLVPDLERLEK